MNIVIGFGSTEQSFEDAEERAIRDYIENRFTSLGLDYFTDEFRNEIAKWLDKRGKESQRIAETYKTAADYPSRYSYYWPSVLADPSKMVVIVTYHHINRRHAMSADGWALLRTEKLFLVKISNIPCAPVAA